MVALSMLNGHIKMTIGRNKSSEKITMTAHAFRHMRKQLGWSAARMGEEMGVDGRSVFRWESGERALEGPAAKLAQKIAKEQGLNFGE